jgi:RNA polymerase sigma-70 factor (ECF subfamily)
MTPAIAKPIPFTSGEAQSALDFAALLREHQGMVFSIALRFLRDRAAAEDMAQEVFLQLHGSLDSLESEEHAKFWLRRVTSHRCLDAVRQRRMALVPLEDSAEPAVQARERDAMLEARLWQAVGSLPATQRMIVVLHYQQELSTEEIAQTMTMPAPTVRSHLRRSLQLLREKLTRMTEMRRTEELR